MEEQPFFRSKIKKGHKRSSKSKEKKNKRERTKSHGCIYEVSHDDGILDIDGLLYDYIPESEECTEGEEEAITPKNTTSNRNQKLALKRLYSANDILTKS